MVVGSHPQLMFQVVKLGEPKVGLEPLPPRTKLSDGVWDALEMDMQDPVITPQKSWELKACWESGGTVIALIDGRIVAHASLIPLYDSSLRSFLASHFKVSTSAFPDIDVYESAAVWTAKAWRSRGLGQRILDSFEGRLNAPGELGLTACYGLAASPVFAKLGWQLVAWDAFKFARHLIGWVEDNQYFWLRSGCIDPLDWLPYTGPHLSLSEFASHDWERYCHFWVQGVEKLQILDRQLKEFMQGDVQAWRQGLKAASLSS